MLVMSAPKPVSRANSLQAVARLSVEGSHGAATVPGGLAGALVFVVQRAFLATVVDAQGKRATGFAIKGSFVEVPPGVTYQVRSSAPATVAVVPLAQPVPSAKSDAGLMFRYDADVAQIFGLLDSAGSDPGEDVLRRSLVAAMAVYVSRSRRKGDGDVCVLPSYKLMRVTEFANANLSSWLSVAQLSEVAELSAAHFARAFKNAIGLTPHQWLLRLRLDAAKTMLATSDTPLSQIAAACGFGDQAHFSRVFREHEKTTPGKYRTTCLEAGAELRSDLGSATRPRTETPAVVH